jgi:hypothetical protein
VRRSFHIQRRYRTKPSFRQRISHRKPCPSTAGETETAGLAAALRQPVRERRCDQRSRIARSRAVRADAKPRAVLKELRIVRSQDLGPLTSVFMPFGPTAG